MDSIKNKKILMALMSFSIGGAETHVLELSLELKRKGFDVVLISGGGEYEKIIAEAGIKHYRAPLYTKNPLMMIKSYRKLKQVIKKEKIDIVHAHGRIPAFLCGLLHKTMDFVFVTTAHWVFTTKYGLKYLSNWGDKVVAVSEDIKKYLMVNYGTNPMDIFVTINGIDTAKFSPDADCASVIEEFKLLPDSRKIVYISRMDEDRAEVAFRLVNIAEEIYKKHNDIEIVIVGGGNVFDKLKEQTDALNEKIGKRLVTLTGARTDIYKFAALSDIFIGVSRSALEAMSCEKPVVVAGNEGYIGIFDEDKLDVSIDTNFCCRGTELSSDERLKSDILKLLESEEAEIARLGEYSRQTITERYSVSKMADDNIKMYKAAADGYKYDVVLSGYYGFNNSGDEALLYGIIQNLRKCKDDIRICVLSKQPYKTAKEYGVHSVNRYNFNKIRKIFKETKLFISGGGSLLQDVTSDKSFWYYTKLIELAHKYGAKIMLYANGIGPLNKEKNRLHTKKILKYAEVITLREDDSKKELEKIGISMKNVEVTADPALSIEPVPLDETERILKSEGIDISKHILGISLREWKNSDIKFAENVSRAINAICGKYNLLPVFIPLKLPEDIEFSMKIANMLNCESKILKGNYTSRQLMGVVGKADVMLAMRLHAAVYAAASYVPSVTLAYDPKIKSFASYVGDENHLDVRNITSQDIINELSAVIGNISDIKSRLEEKKELFIKNALHDAETAVSIVEKISKE